MKRIEQSILNRILDHLWDIQGKIKQLAGFEDQNFYIKDQRGDEWLLKVASEKHTELLEAQSGLFNVRGIDIKSEMVDDLFVRLIPWVPGHPWASLTYKSPELLYDLGLKMAEHLNQIKDYEHSALMRENFEWDLANALWIKDHLEVLEQDLKNVIRPFVIQFEKVQEHYDTLPKATIHNDLNDYNILVKGQSITGFIDYGDACFSQRVNEIAIALAYIMMDEIAPLDSAAHVIRGFCSCISLSTDEIRMLYNLICMRLSVSLVTSAQNMIDRPENEYLQVSRRPAIQLIKRLSQLGESWSTYKFLDAAGFQLPLNMPKINSSQVHQVVNFVKGDYINLDLSVASEELGHESEYLDAYSHHEAVTRLRKRAGKSIAIGAYNEVRPLYSSDDFTEMGNDGQRWRTVHIGLDFFAEAGTEVYAFMDGKVHAVNYNAGDKNYGNTVILKHDGFYTLYGHLSSKTLVHLKPGQEVKGGELIAWFGEPQENGNWAPHLHFQLILDMLTYKDDFPGVCLYDEREIWTQISPDPRPLLGIEVSEAQRMEADEIFALRKKHLGKSYSLSYDQPLHIVRAHEAYLYDHTGRKYLDGVNNVPHVGHQNSRVVKTASKQAALLNTNTRYLHPKIVKLAKKLTDLMPAHLKVCHFVNSGSEANELAIRMARTATGRNGVVAMEHGYHGNTSLCVDISSYKFDGKGGQGKRDFVQIIPMPDPIRSDRHSKFTIDPNQELPATFIHESILSCGGQVVLPNGFFQELYKDFRALGMLMIADEVQTGLGRVGSHMWAFEVEGLSPDIVTIGKPFGNGSPLAAVVCTEEVAEAFHNGMEYFNTFGGNPVSCSIGLEVLSIIEENDLQKHAFRLGQWIKNQLEKLAKTQPFIVDVRGRGLFLGWEFADPHTLAPLPQVAARFVNEMKRHGVLLSTDGPFHNVIKFKPPMIFSQNQATYMLDRAKLVLSYL